MSEKYEPLSWLLVFEPRTTWPWLDRLVPGRFKHVCAFGWVEATKSWLHFDVELGRTRLLALPADAGELLVAAKLCVPGTGALRVPVNERARLVPVAGWCVPAMRHLVGLRSGALLPIGLWRDCIASGAEVIHDDETEGTAGHSGRPDAGGDCAAARGGDFADRGHSGTGQA